jgi:hypothetical protein
MQSITKKTLCRAVLFLALLSLPVALLTASGGTAARAASTVTSSSLGTYSPTFVGPAATGCPSGCSLLSGPYVAPSTASYALGSQSANAIALKRAAAIWAARKAAATRKAAALKTAAASLGIAAKALPSPVLSKNGKDPAPPTVSCQPIGPGCDTVSGSSGGAIGVKGLNAVDSASATADTLFPDIEPPDQGLCAGNGYVVESDNVGEILIFNTRLHRVSQVISLDAVMGLTSRNWSSGGDISCLYDYSNGGHFIFTEFVSASPESSGGAFAGCFNSVANTCYEGIAVTRGNDPFGPYNDYYLNSNYNPSEPGAPYLLNDFTKIGATRDAFLLFYDEFPLNTPGIGGGFFNGAQEYALGKNALERGVSVTKPDGTPNPRFNVAIENMGLLATPDGTCASDNTFHQPGFTCWFSVIPAQAPDPSQWDNSHGGSGFMLDTLDYYGQGDTRLAAFDWTGLHSLDSTGSGVKFGGQLFSGVQYYYGEGFMGKQKAGPIPLGDECGAAGLSTGTTPPASCPEGGIATNGDNFTQASQAQGELWGSISTEVTQTFGATSEIHQGVAYWVVNTDSFDRTGVFGLTSQGYVSAAHEDLSMPAVAAEGYRWQDGGNGGAILAFTLTGTDYYPSTAYGRLTSTSGTLLDSKINIADLGQAPQDGFTEYQGYPGTVRPRWGDYSAAIFLPGSDGRIYFANEYIQYPNCTGTAFSATAIGTCGGTRDGMANWGTSVNYVVP